MLPGENGGGGVKDVKDALSLELGKRVDAVCELGVIVVACASNQVVGGEGASEACARMQQRGAREGPARSCPRCSGDLEGHGVQHGRGARRFCQHWISRRAR